MALELGFKVPQVRDGAWKGDVAYINITPGALADWERDGQAIHLRPFELNGKATIVKWRGLDGDEAAYAERYKHLSTQRRFHRECFALGARIPDLAEDGMSSDGTRIPSMTIDVGQNFRLSKPVLDSLEEKYPGLVDFFGEKIADATYPSEAAKKASSPRSTQSPSEAEDVTPPSTEGNPSAPVSAA